MKSSYDILIIGAGPAGLAAANRISSISPLPSVLLADKIKPWERPIACAEGVFRVQFEKVIDPKPAWIRFLVDKAVYHSPDNYKVHYSDNNKGYILDRSVMQKDMAMQCAEKGVECLFGHRVITVGPWNDTDGRTVILDDGTPVKARVVIDCSGPLSTLGKGEKIHSKAMDMEVACLAHLTIPSVDTETVHLHAGWLIAPGAYAWAFPRTDRSINVGVIVGASFKSGANIRRLLDSFISTYYPEGRTERIFAGSIPCAFGRPPISTFGLVKAGDSASMVNPVSRAGITEALIAGNLAGKCALSMLGAQTKKDVLLASRTYEREWLEKRGKRHAKLAKVKHSLVKVPDSDYNASARTLGPIPREQLTMSKIFAISLSRFPRLVWALRHVL
jgi:geranylgeranyl reductase family protein